MSTDPLPPIPFRGSAAPAWLQCPRNADFEDTHSDDDVDRRLYRRGAPVARVYGTRVHAAVLGGDPGRPDAIEFDQYTRTERELARQVAVAAADIRGWLDFMGWVLEHRELPLKASLRYGASTLAISGTLDAIARAEDGRRLILDLKTGRRDPHEAWAQMAVYAWLCEAALPPGDPRPVAAGIFHVPRGADGLDFKHTRDIRPRALGEDGGRRPADRAARRPLPALRRRDVRLPPETGGTMTTTDSGRRRRAEAMAAAAIAGKSLAEIGREHGLHRNTVRVNLRRYGFDAETLPLSPTARIAANLDAVIERRRAGVGWKWIAREFGARDSHAVKLAAKRACKRRGIAWPIRS